MEVQFNRSSHAGTIFTGPVSRIGMIGGILLSVIFDNICSGLLNFNHLNFRECLSLNSNRQLNIYFYGMSFGVLPQC